MTKLNELEYNKPGYQLKKMGALLECDGDEMLAEMYDKGSFDHYFQKWIDSDDEYDYYVLFKIGYVVFIPFYCKERTLRDLFLSCKDYRIHRIRIGETDAEVSDSLDKDERVAFADSYGPLDGTYYNEDLYTEYAKQTAAKFVK